MTRKYNGALFFFFRSLSVAALRCPIVSRWQCASTPHNPVYLHPLQSSGEQEPEGRLERVQRHTRETMSGRHLHCSRRKEQNKKNMAFVIYGVFQHAHFERQRQKKHWSCGFTLFCSILSSICRQESIGFALHTQWVCACARVFCASLLIYVSLLSILPLLLFGVIVVIICSCLLGL